MSYTATRVLEYNSSIHGANGSVPILEVCESSILGVQCPRGRDYTPKLLETFG